MNFFNISVIKQSSAGGESVSASEYTGIAAVTEFIYGQKLGQAVNGKNQFKYFKNFGEDWGMMSRFDALVFIDNHDNQRGSDSNIITFRTPRKYKVKYLVRIKAEKVGSACKTQRSHKHIRKISIL